MSNWKAPGPDFVQGFWLKNFKTIQEGLRRNDDGSGTESYK